MFHIGQQVVCIMDNWADLDPDEVCPVKGQVYTIREIIPYTDGIHFRFEEIVNKPLHYKEGLLECHFSFYAFRPVRKTNIDVFTAMLAPADGSKVAA